MNLPVSVTTKSQKRRFEKQVKGHLGIMRPFTVDVRFDDSCGNGQNSFSITGNFDNSCWCIHEDIAKHFPDLAHLIKYHLFDTRGPMYYIENTMHHALEHGPKSAYLYFEDKDNGLDSKCMKSGKVEEIERIAATRPDLYTVKVQENTAKVANLKHARSSACWPDATIEQLSDKEALQARLPALMDGFHTAMLELGFKY